MSLAVPTVSSVSMFLLQIYNFQIVKFNALLLIIAE